MSPVRVLAALIASLLFSSGAFAGGGSAAWRMEDAEKPIGHCGFALQTEGSGFRFVSGSYTLDEEDWERLEISLDRDLKIQSLRFEALQNGVRIETNGRQEKDQLRLEHRKGGLPARFLSIPSDTAVRELAILRQLGAASAGKNGETTVRIVEPVDLALFTASVHSEKLSGEECRIRMRSSRVRGVHEILSYRMISRDPKSFDFTVVDFEGDPELRFRKSGYAEVERQLETLASRSAAEVELFSPARKEVNSILEAAVQGQEADHHRLVEKLSQLGPSLPPIVRSLRGEKLEPIQKILLGLSLPPIGNREALSTFLEWIESVGSYERMLIVRGLSTERAVDAVPALIEILQHPELGLEREATKSLSAMGARLGNGELRKVLVTVLGKEKSPPEGKPGTVLPLFRFVAEQKVSIPASVWLSALERNPVEERRGILALIGRGLVEGNPESQHALVDRVESILENAENPAERAEAAGALGRLRRLESVPQLVQILDQEIVGPRAHAALQEITKLQFPPDPERWRRWWDEEKLRFEKDLPLALEKLQNERKEEKLAAISGLTRFTLGREEIVLALNHCLEDPEEDVRNAAQRLLKLWND